MNTCYQIQKNRLLFGIVFLLSFFANSANAELCNNPKDSIYGLTTTGQVVAINVKDAKGTAIGLPALGAINANAVGFSPITSLFYFFNKNGGAVQQFVSFNPMTAALTPLAVSPIPAAYTIRSGTLNPLGSSYYTIDTAMVPSRHSNLFRYDIVSNTWITITSSIVDPSSNPIPDLDTLVSGDMAFDGNNNLWIVASSKWHYALYKIKAPVPTSPTASVT